MITNLDRSFSFGASDTHYFFMNTNTKTFEKWWAVKMGIMERTVIENVYMTTGTLLEQPILDTIEDNITRNEVIKYEYDLIVNLDGRSDKIIYEVKTMKFATWLLEKVDKKYWQQVQVQLLATGYVNAILVSYGVLSHEYEFSYWLDPKIDKNRIRLTEISYDADWCENVYLPRLQYLSKCLREGSYPNEK